MTDADTIAGLGNRSSMLWAAPDALRRDLSPEEIKLVSCIGSGASLGAVLAQCQLSQPKAIALLLGLRLRGIVHPMSAGFAPSGAADFHPPPTPPPEKPKPVLVPRPTDTARAAETVELDEARKKEIQEYESRLAKGNYFDLLGVSVQSGPNEIKKAYYELTKRFHPDRYYGKTLGSYKERIERVFKGLTEAQSTLTEAPKRQAYLARHPQLTPAPVVHSKATNQARAAERRARLAKHPYLAKQNRLHQLVDHAKKHLEEGDGARANLELQLASQIAPRSSEVADLLKTAKKAGDRQAARDSFSQAVSLFNSGDLAAAIVLFKNACSLDQENAEYAHRATVAMLQVSGSAALKDAHGLARRAAELAPQNVEYRLNFASVLLMAGMDKNAVREYEAVLKLVPDHAIAKEQLKKLKWKL